MTDNISSKLKVNQTDVNTILRVLSTPNRSTQFMIVVIVLFIIPTFVSLFNVSTIYTSTTGLLFWLFSSILGAGVGTSILYSRGVKLHLSSGLIDFLLVCALIFESSFTYAFPSFLDWFISIGLNTLLFTTLLTFTFSAFTSFLVLWAIHETRYCVDLITRELVIKSYPAILRYPVEKRVKRESLKTGRINWNYVGLLTSGTLILELLSGDEIWISAPKDSLSLAALYLLKLLKLPLTIEEESPDPKSEKWFTPDMLQGGFSPSQYDSKFLETELPKLGWKKGSNVPVVLQEMTRVPVIFTMLTLLSGALWLGCYLAYEAEILEKTFSLVLFSVLTVVTIVFLILSIWISKSLVRIDEKGLQSGSTLLGIPLWGVCWRYDFIRDLKIQETENKFHVVVDFFIGTKTLGIFKSMQVANQFRDYVSFICFNFQKESLTLSS
ncbi:MAG: hypothetical protein ACFFDI_19470 [Promethearchaeota archaeon]